MTRFFAIALIVAAGASSSGAADRHSLMIRGTVVDAAGSPITPARVFLDGPQTASTTVDAQGAYTLRIPVADWTALERTPLTVWLDAGRTDWSFNLAGGGPALRLEVRARRDSTGARRCVIRSNDNDVTAKLARGIASRGAVRDTIEVRFVGTAGPDAGFRDLPMFSMEDVAVPAPPRAAASAAGKPPASKPPAPRPDSAGITAAPPNTAATSLDTLRSIVVVRPGDTLIAPAPRLPAAGDTCVCRIEGTVEVRSRGPLAENTPVVFWLESNPAVRDSVELFMGSPRPFSLVARGCGSHRVRMEVRGRGRFNLGSPIPVIDCIGNRTRQVRVVLVPG